MTIPSTQRPPAVSTDQMREVDRIMMEDMGIDLIRMMENAGRNLAWLSQHRFSPTSVTVLAGPGGNGGGGMVAARHLANRGISVTITLIRDDLAPVAADQASALKAMGVAFSDEPSDADLVIDALIGYSLSGDPRERAAALIEWANHQASPVLALDVPSGLDTSTGMIGDPCVRATATMTLALPKTGLEFAPTVVGELYLADISVPPSVYTAFGIELDDPFTNGPVVGIAI
jgi:NAD(P)H-hydrate epimerase